jgi:hypothetical protein
MIHLYKMPRSLLAEECGFFVKNSERCIFKALDVVSTIDYALFLSIVRPVIDLVE